MNKTYLQVWIFVGMIGLVPSGVWAQPPSTETQDLDELERRIDILSDEMDELKESGGASDYDKVRVHGYGELHFNMPTDGRTRQVDNHRFVLGVHAPLADWIHLNAEIDFEHAAQELEFEFGYLDFLLDPKYNVRAGVVLIPVGFLNEFHEPPLFWTVDHRVESHLRGVHKNDTAIS